MCAFVFMYCEYNSCKLKLKHILNFIAMKNCIRRMYTCNRSKGNIYKFFSGRGSIACLVHDTRL